jgi:hypothetical protein
MASGNKQSKAAAALKRKCRRIGENIQANNELSENENISGNNRRRENRLGASAAQAST